MLDRIDIHIEVPRVNYEKLSSDRLGESSVALRERVQAARKRQRVRFEGSDSVCNFDMRAVEIRKFCNLDGAGDNLVRAAILILNLAKFAITVLESSHIAGKKGDSLARRYRRVMKLRKQLQI